MASFSDGSEVVFQGESAPEGPRAGDSGRVLLAHERGGAHVSWTTGSMKGQVSLALQEDLALLHDHSVEAALVDSLWVATETEHHSASVLYSEGGADSLISAMAAKGSTDYLTEIASEALDMVTLRVAQLVDVEGHGLDDEAKDDVVRTLTAEIFREMLSGDEDD